MDHFLFMCPSNPFLGDSWLCVANTAKASRFQLPIDYPVKWPEYLPPENSTFSGCTEIFGPRGVGEIVGGAFLACDFDHSPRN